MCVTWIHEQILEWIQRPSHLWRKWIIDTFKKKQNIIQLGNCKYIYDVFYRCIHIWLLIYCPSSTISMKHKIIQICNCIIYTFFSNIKCSLLKLLCTLMRLWDRTLLQLLRLDFFGLTFPRIIYCNCHSYFLRQDNRTRGKLRIFYERSPLPNLPTPETSLPNPYPTYPLPR